MPREGIVFLPSHSRRIRAAVEHYEHAPRNSKSVRSAPLESARTQHGLWEGVLDDDLDAASAIGTPTTATLSVYRRADGATTMIDTGTDITVTNRSRFSAKAGDYLLVARAAGEWRPVDGGGGGEGHFEVVRVDTLAGYTVGAGPDLVVACYPQTAGGVVPITLGAGALGQEITIKAMETPHIIGMTVNFTYNTGTGTAVAAVLTGGQYQRLVYLDASIEPGNPGWYDA